MNDATSHILSANPPAEQGFTIVELVVVLVIIGIASAAVFPTITSLFGTSKRTAALSHAGGEARIGVRMFQADVRSARGFRSTSLRGDLAPDSVETTSGALASDVAHLHDVVTIAPDRLVLYTEVNQNPIWTNPEFVEWKVVESLSGDPVCGSENDRGNWCVTRTVIRMEDDGTFDGGRQMIEVVAKGEGRYPRSTDCDPSLGYSTDEASTPVLFCYQTARPVLNGAAAEDQRYIWNTGWTNECENTSSIDRLDLATATGWHDVQRTGFDAQTRIHDVDTIVSISIALPSESGFGGKSERAIEQGRASIKSRTNAGYMTSIMCGSRS